MVIRQRVYRITHSAPDRWVVEFAWVQLSRFSRFLINLRMIDQWHPVGFDCVAYTVNDAHSKIEKHKQQAYEDAARRDDRAAHVTRVVHTERWP